MERMPVLQRVGERIIEAQRISEVDSHHALHSSSAFFACCQGCNLMRSVSHVPLMLAFLPLAAECS